MGDDACSVTELVTPSTAAAAIPRVNTVAERILNMGELLWFGWKVEGALALQRRDDLFLRPVCRIAVARKVVLCRICSVLPDRPRTRYR